jgi:hypothetical protein
MNATGSLVGVFLDEVSLDDESAPEIVLSVFAEDDAVRTLTSGETLDVRIRAVLEQQVQGPRLRLHWQVGESQCEQVVHLGEVRQRELLRRLSTQTQLPLVISSTNGEHAEVYDCENLFRAQDAEPPRMTIRMRHGCRHTHSGRHTAHSKRF